MLEVIKKYAGLPFSYGSDCCQFAGECVESLTGKNPMEGFSYEDEHSAYEIIDAYGGLANAITSRLGEPYDGFDEGDVCLIGSGDGRQVAGVVFKGRIVARVKGGLMDYPKERAVMVWKICRQY